MLDVDRLGGVGWRIVVRRPDAEEADLELARGEGEGGGREGRRHGTIKSPSCLVSTLCFVSPAPPYKRLRGIAWKQTFKLFVREGRKKVLKRSEGEPPWIKTRGLQNANRRRIASYLKTKSSFVRVEMRKGENGVFSNCPITLMSVLNMPNELFDSFAMQPPMRN